MANPTTNFGWVMPTSSSLVTNLPADFNTFGQAVDTSMAQLKGGTTGQVLSKTSATDMAFTWVTTDDANAIQNSIVDAKGDLISATGSDVPARLAVGNNGETLVADSSTSTGLRYQVPVNVNPVLNAAMQVWQRGTSFSGSGASNTYAADRWKYYNNGTSITVSRQTTSDTTNLPNIQYCTRVARNNASTNVNTNYYEQSFETINSIPFAGKTVTISFYARKGANYSTASNTLTCRVNFGTGTDQDWLSGYTGDTAVIETNATLTTTWQRFTATGTVGTTATELAVIFSNVPVGTAGAADYYEVTGVQLEVGSVATPFKTYAGTIQGELAACQRYYIRTTGGSSTGNSMGFQSQATTTTIVDFMIAPQVSMRTAPTSVDYSNIGVYRYANATNYTGGTVTLYLSSSITNTIVARYTHGSAIFTINDGVAMNTGSNAATFIGFSAEL